jgi:hypothetical protein
VTGRAVDGAGPDRRSPAGRFTPVRSVRRQGPGRAGAGPRRVLATVVVAGAVALAGCTGPTDTRAVADAGPATTAAPAARTDVVTPAAVAEAEQRWRAKGPGAYRWRVLHECFCAGATVDISVANGTITGVDVVDEGRTPYPQEVAEIDSLTIDLLFARMIIVLDGGGTVHGTFDATNGHPVSVTLDGGGGAPDTYQTIELEARTVATTSTTRARPAATTSTTRGASRRR